MEFELYVVARRSRLLEHAVELGVTAEQAPALVDRVLDEQRRTISRSDDPDPEVREALSEAVLGRARRPLVAPLAAIALMGLGVLLVIRFVTVEPPVDPRVPSTYALDAAAASTLLTDAGFEVTTQEIVVCETADQVVATEPAAGTVVAEGSPITVMVASPPGLSCPGGGGFREDVWAFLRWVRGLGPPPALVEVPSVVLVDPSGARTVQLSRADLLDRVAGGELLDELRTVVVGAAPTSTGFPRLSVTNGDPRPPCGLAPPDGTDSLLTIRFQLATAEAGDGRCPLTGYLVPEGDRLAAIVLLLPAR